MPTPLRHCGRSESTASVDRLVLDASAGVELVLRTPIGRLVTAPLNRVSVAPLLPEAWALRHNLTVADALYVVVASHLEAALVTTDQRLAAAPALQVETITP